MSGSPLAQLTFAELAGAGGRRFGPSAWMVIDQERIDVFAAAVDDQQWIHVDPVRAAEGPFGRTIAHGFLTLAAAATRLGDLITVADASRVINYGLDRVRFPAPVVSGARMNATVEVAEVVEIEGGLEVRATVTANVEGIDRPVCVAETRTRYMR